MNILGLIPARGGSKGVPMKNIRNFNNNPLIYYTICEGKKSRYIDKLIVSTDDETIAHIALEYGADVPFLRPKELAQDNSLAIDAYIYTLNRLAKEFNYNANILVILQPTSPLRKVSHIDECIELFINKNADSVVSVCEVEHSPYWYKVIDCEGRIKDFTVDGNSNNINRQQLPKVYRPNGAVYVFRSKFILEEKSYYSKNSYGYVMGSEESVDIDTFFDFKIAEFIFKQNLNNTDNG